MTTPSRRHPAVNVSMPDDMLDTIDREGDVAALNRPATIRAIIAGATRRGIVGTLIRDGAETLEGRWVTEQRPPDRWQRLSTERNPVTGAYVWGRGAFRLARQGSTLPRSMEKQRANGEMVGWFLTGPGLTKPLHVGDTVRDAKERADQMISRMDHDRRTSWEFDTA